MLVRLFLPLLVLAALVSGRACFAEDLFAAGVRSTEPLVPEEELKKFKLPAGFEMQLVAAEPDIHKPVNMAFDAKGRLWVTSTVEYPWPAKDPAAARDAIIILEDFDASGRARKVTRFAETLNIPIGLYPYKNGVIAYSIPNVWFIQDTDGDGKADKRDVLAGPFGTDRDTHGMTSSLRRGFDGYIYANHGFNNQSSPKGTDGSTFTMQSGNTWRMHTDGTKLEQYTWGQVNPFGKAIDPWGNQYTADCHSSPIYQILRGAYYPSFGKPHDGLGYGPTMMNHTHGSTAIGGIVYFADDRFPEAFQHNFIVGNVMTSRVNRDTLEEHGSTRIAKEATDLVESADPWFRPVDLQLGPDGAIYIADFYNRIIGHYEVPLTHPGRDRERGRIWRIVYRGEKGDAALAGAPDLSKEAVAGLIAALDHPNLTVRFLALTELSDRIGAPAAEPLRAALKDAKPRVRLGALWALFRLNALSDAELETALGDGDGMVRTHAFRALSERENCTDGQRAALIKGLSDSDPFARRQAADAAGRHPSLETARALIVALNAAPKDDTHLTHTQRMALRNHVAADTVGAQMMAQLTTDAERRAIGDVAQGAKSVTGARLVLQSLNLESLNGDALNAKVRYLVRYLPEAELESFLKQLHAKAGGNSGDDLALLKALGEGYGQRGIALPAEVKTWAESAVLSVLQPPKAGDAAGWNGRSLDGTRSERTWPGQERPCSDGKKASLYSSFPLGEPFIGVLRSAPFAAPKALSFYLCGHNGAPPQEHPRLNFIRLVDAASGEMLMEATPPRNDTAQRIEWNLEKMEGRQVALEAVDGDAATAYAWLAFGRFEPHILPEPSGDTGRAGALKPALELARALNVANAAPAAAALIEQRNLPSDLRVAAVQTALALDNAQAASLGAALQHSDAVEVLDALAKALGATDAPAAREALLAGIRAAPLRQQIKYAQALCGNRNGATALLDAVEKGTVARALLTDEGVKKRVQEAGAENAAERIAKLTQGVKAPDSEVQKLIDTRRGEYGKGKATPALGAAVFAKNCSICHQLEGKGALVGPQLDGVGGRGLERLCEDILDPHRNVDVAFRTSTLKLQDGRAVTGLFRREEGETLVFADSTGKEFEVKKADVKTRRESEYSLMPDNFGDVLTSDDFRNLLGYLMSLPGPK
jgi:putative heme-binding domain-containing protein